MRGMNNMQGMMKKMKKMQKEMEAAQEELATSVFTGEAGGGLVKVTVNGDRQVTEVSIDSEVFEDGDSELLADLVMIAVNNALAEVEQITEERLGKYTKGLNLPGF